MFPKFYEAIIIEAPDHPRGQTLMFGPITFFLLYSQCLSLSSLLTFCAYFNGTILYPYLVLSLNLLTGCSNGSFPPNLWVTTYAGLELNEEDAE